MTAAQITGIVYAANAATIVSGQAQLDFSGSAQQGIISACVCDDVYVLGNAKLVINASQNPQPPGGSAAPAGATPGAAKTPAQTAALNAFFRQLLNSETTDELMLWTLGAGGSNADHSLLRHSR